MVNDVRMPVLTLTLSFSGQVVSGWIGNLAIDELVIQTAATILFWSLLCLSSGRQVPWPKVMLCGIASEPASEILSRLPSMADYDLEGEV